MKFDLKWTRLDDHREAICSTAARSLSCASLSVCEAMHLTASGFIWAQGAYLGGSHRAGHDVQKNNNNTSME